MEEMVGVRWLEIKGWEDEKKENKKWGRQRWDVTTRTHPCQRRKNVFVAFVRENPNIEKSLGAVGRVRSS